MSFKKGCSVYLNAKDLKILSEVSSHFFCIESSDIDEALLEYEENYRSKLGNLLTKIKNNAQHANKSVGYRRF